MLGILHHLRPIFMKAFQGGPISAEDYAALKAALRVDPSLRSNVTRLAHVIRRHPKTTRALLADLDRRGPAARPKPRKRARAPAVKEHVAILRQLLRKRHKVTQRKEFGTHNKLMLEMRRRGHPLTRNQVRYRAGLAGAKGRIRPQTPTMLPDKLAKTKAFAVRTAEWASDENNMKKTIWCDEWPGSTCDKSERTELCLAGTLPAPRVRRKRYATHGLQAWVVIAWNWKDIVFADSRTTRMNSRTYRESCLKKVLPRLQQGVFVQDNARCHWGNCSWATNPDDGPMAETNREWLKNNNVETLELPPDAPQLNCCENIFSIMNVDVAENAHSIDSPGALEAAMSNWCPIPTQRIFG
jgi:hypothetical protein